MGQYSISDCWQQFVCGMVMAGSGCHTREAGLLRGRRECAPLFQEIWRGKKGERRGFYRETR